MNFQLTEEQILIQKTARQFADTELAPGVVERDDKKIWPKEGISKMAALGFMGMMTDPKWDGEGMDTISYTIAIEEISRVEASAGVIMSVNNSLVCSLLENFASDNIKEKYLKPLASGDKLGAFSLGSPPGLVVWSANATPRFPAAAKSEGSIDCVPRAATNATTAVPVSILVTFSRSWASRAAAPSGP